MRSSDENFYANLPAQKTALSVLLAKNKAFKKIPVGWSVIITDIKSSTSAVLAGNHENVNFIATGSIAAVLNIAFKENIILPFFFGGDGATFIVPPKIVEPAMHALRLFSINTLTNYNLDLRAGIVPVKEIYDQGYQINVCKFSSATDFSIPIILGNGLNYAEKVIKGDDYLFEHKIIDNKDLDLSGMQCRWDKIDPPEHSEEVITLIVIAKDEDQQAPLFSKVIALLDEIYGEQEKRQPISVNKLIFRTSFNNLRREMMTRLGNIKILELLKTWAVNMYGYIYFRTEKGQRYLRRMVEMSDTLVIDGKINTVITGTEKQRLLLQEALNKLESEGKILYALYVSKESVMSCYVRDLVDDHIHFVDGGEGGYTKAAGILKKKLVGL